MSSANPQVVVTGVHIQLVKRGRTLLVSTGRLRYSVHAVSVWVRRRSVRQYVSGQTARL